MYLKMNDYPNSIKYLSEFSSDDILLSSLATGSIGDAFSELNQFDDALDYYVKASKSNNNYSSPMYLFKAGTVAMRLNKFNKATLIRFCNIKTSALSLDMKFPE